MLNYQRVSLFTITVPFFHWQKASGSEISPLTQRSCLDSTRGWKPESQWLLHHPQHQQRVVVCSNNHPQNGTSYLRNKLHGRCKPFPNGSLKCNSFSLQRFSAYKMNMVLRHQPPTNHHAFFTLFRQSQWLSYAESLGNCHPAATWR